MEVVKVKEAADWIMQLNQWISELDIQSLYLPAGNTPIPLYQNWEKTKPRFLNGLKFIQIDDVIFSTKAGMFREFFKEHLPSYLDQFHWIIDEEVQADMALLGLGINGHVGFHEPHLPHDFAFGELDLSEKSVETLGLEKGARGKSYGLGHFLKCRHIAFLVFDEKKRAILENVLKDESELPASQVIRHPSVKLYTDLKISW